MFTVKQYREAVQKIEKFFSNLDPKTIFKQGPFEDPNFDVNMATSIATINIIESQKYLDYQLVALSFLEALSVQLGGEYPYAIFFGETPRYNSNYSKSFFQIFKKIRHQKSPFMTPVEALLKKGRKDRFEFDFAQSPMGAFFYDKLSYPEILELKKYALHFFNNYDSIGASDFLLKFPPQVCIKAFTYFIGFLKFFEPQLRVLIDQHKSKYLQGLVRRQK